MSECEKGAIALALIILLFIGSTIYFAYYAYKFQQMLIEEWDKNKVPRK